MIKNQLNLENAQNKNVVVNLDKIERHRMNQDKWDKFKLYRSEVIVKYIQLRKRS